MQLTAALGGLDLFCKTVTHALLLEVHFRYAVSFYTLQVYKLGNAAGPAASLSYKAATQEDKLLNGSVGCQLARTA